jgi:sugar transferase (PEP-CTERM system associated)
VIRVFNSYVPSRTLILLGGEIATIGASFALAILIRFGSDSRVIFNDEHELLKIVVITILALLCSHYMDLYDMRRLADHGEMYSRILLLIGTLAVLLAGVTYVYPEFIVGRNVFLTGICILAITWTMWRWVYGRLILFPALRERVYLLGDGERARRIYDAIHSREELGMDVVGWVCDYNPENVTRESLANVLKDLARRRAVDRVIVALTDRRTMMPVNELLEMRMNGVRIDDGTSLLEMVSGQIEVDELQPSWMIFSDGFHLSSRHRFVRRIVSVILALILTILTFPFIPIVALLIKLTSSGPILYRQERVGMGGHVFHCLKFRTMRTNAEADSGPTWASDDDPRITKVGRFLRRSRLDEIPQIWNVLRGDMSFVGPRPERPEFVKKLSSKIRYYHLRHLARPGITGWAQINYGYGSSVEEAKEKLRYDLYYIRNVSVMLDLLIVFYTVRAVIFGRGVR